jgi:hypothetical protein
MRISTGGENYPGSLRSPFWLWHPSLVIKKTTRWILIDAFAAGNVLVVIVDVFFMGKKKAATNMLMANISVSDSLTAAVCIPVQVRDCL